MQEDLNINVKGNILEVLKGMKSGFDSASSSTEKFEKTATGSLSKIEKSLRGIKLAAFQQNLQSLNQGFQDLNAPGISFNKNLKGLSALTGTTGKALESLGKKARESSKEFGGPASDALGNYQTILSRLGPGIAKDEKALVGMERNVQILSKTMGGDAAGAVDALTTGMLQFGVDLSNPKTAVAEMTKMMDVMANAAQEGAAEVPQISAALKVSGVAAKQAKVSFIEANAAIQTLAEGGKEGAEAGVSLRTVLQKMAGEDIISKEALDKLKAMGVDMNLVSNTSIPFTDRLRELGKAQGDATIMTQIFGDTHSAAADILINSVDAQDELSKVIGKVGGAQAQANIVMESTEEKMARIKAEIDDVKISFFESTGGLTAYLEPLTEVGQTMTSMTPIFRGVKGGFTMAKDLVTKSAPKMLAYAKGLKDVGSSAKGAGGAMKGMSSMLAAGPWVALAAGVALVAYRLIDVASGAQEARRNLEEMQKGMKAGADRGGRVTGFQQQKDNDKIRVLENKKTAGEITPEKFNKQKLEILENQSRAMKGEMQTANLSKQRAKEAYESQKKKEAKADKVIEFEKSLFGIENENTKTSMKKGAIYSANKEYSVISESKKATDKEIEALKAEMKGANLGTPKGYTPKEETEVRQGAGEVKSINVRIENLIRGDVVVKSTTVSDGMAVIKKQVTEALVSAVRDFEVAI